MADNRFRGAITSMLRGVCLSAAVATVGGGCALVDMKIDLQGYQVAGGTSGGAGAVAVAPAGAAPFDKSKDGATIIGDVKNGYGTVTAHVVTDESVPEWVTTALVDELSVAGFKPSVNPSPTAARFAVQTYISRAYVADDIGAVTVGQVAEVILRITLVVDGTPAKLLDVKGVGNIRGFVQNPGLSKREALRAALQAAIEKTMPEIVATFK